MVRRGRILPLFLAGAAWLSATHTFVSPMVRPVISRAGRKPNTIKTMCKACLNGDGSTNTSTVTEIILPTSVEDIYGVPGGTWGTQASHGGAWGYFVPQGPSQGQGMRKVDTSHVSEKLAGFIQCLEAELALPWGFLIKESDGTVTLVDAPYFSEQLVGKIKELAPNGLKHIFFTHSDFIGMAEPMEWRKVFPSAKIVAHKEDVLGGGAMESETLLEGLGPWHFGDYRIDAAPGHTKGSIIISSFPLSTSFGGDSMGFWEGAATGYPKMARYSCREQAKSLRSFSAAAPFFKFWFPGHGQPLVFADAAERHDHLIVAAEGLERAAVHDNVTAP